MAIVIAAVSAVPVEQPVQEQQQLVEANEELIALLVPDSDLEGAETAHHGGGFGGRGYGGGYGGYGGYGGG